MHFNSQPHEEADHAMIMLSGIIHHFNSQPHEEADKEITEYEYDRDISTHSLTKRLT